MTFINNFSNTSNSYLENSFPNHSWEENANTFEDSDFLTNNYEISNHLTNNIEMFDYLNNNCGTDLEFLNYFSNSSTNFKLGDPQTILQKEISDLAKKETYKKSTDAINKRILSEPSDDDFFTPIIASLPHINQIDRIQILTGKLKKHRIPSDASRELKENLKIAKRIIQHVNSVVPFSFNYLQRSSIFTSDMESDINQHLEYQKIVESAIGASRKETSFSIESIAEKSIEYKTGNCGEMSKVGFLYAKGLGTSIELTRINKECGGDHTFLIVGRDEPSKVICDVWTGAYFPALKSRKYLMNFVNLIHINGMQYTVVENFDPKKHSLDLIARH